MQHILSTLEKKQWRNGNIVPSTLEIPWSEGIHSSQTFILKLIVKRTTTNTPQPTSNNNENKCKKRL
jgi:hypothetical protein